MSRKLCDWTSFRSGRRYTIYEDDFGGLSCSCPCCQHGGECREVQRIAAERTLRRLRESYRRVFHPRPKDWSSKFPELVPIFKTDTKIGRAQNEQWRYLNQRAFAVKCY